MQQDHLRFRRAVGRPLNRTPLFAHRSASAHLQSVLDCLSASKRVLEELTGVFEEHTRQGKAQLSTLKQSHNVFNTLHNFEGY